MTPTTLSVITFLLLGAVSLTNSRPVAVSIKELIQNSFKKPLPQVVYPQETAIEKSMLNIKPVSEMVYRQEIPQKSVQNSNMKPMDTQEESSLLENDVMAHVTDECTQVYNWCRESGYYSLVFCLGVYVECVAV